MPGSAVADLVGRVLASRYRLLGPVGLGSSGRVYVADDVRLRRRVAVKVLHSGLAGDVGFLRRFRSEAQTAASLNHPHVMAVYDWGDDAGVPFMVLELLRGGSLRALLDTGVRLTASQATHIGRQVAAALQYAHGRGIVHRDIKPANLLFDEHGIVRVADFGLARALAEASWTEPSGGGIVGTARYAAPEQATGAVDGRADLYALSVVLVESCTGEVPVVADTPIATLAMRATRGISAPPRLGPLAAVIERAGRPDVASRYPDAAQMGAALAAAGRQLQPPARLELVGIGDAIDEIDATNTPHDAPGGGNGARRGTAPPGATSDDATHDDAAVPLAVLTDDHVRMRRSTIPLVVGAAVLVVVGLAVAAYAAIAPGPSVLVPTLVGVSEARAAATATDAGFLMKVVERRIADDPKGLVIEQQPGPGAYLADGEEVEVVVSRGPPRVGIPDVAGQPLADAQAALEEAGFVVIVEPRHDEEIAKDIALGTEPAGGGRAPRESEITLLVSDGPAPVPVPDVAGRTYDEAAAILTEARLTAVYGEAFSDTVAVGKAVGTNPSVGTPAPRDSEVVVLISKGPEIVTVPNVVGMTVEAASQALANVGLVPDVENYGPGKTVRAQDPGGGAKVKKGSKVTLFL